MISMYLKAADQATLDAALVAAGVLVSAKDDAGANVLVIADMAKHRLDRIGPIPAIYAWTYAADGTPIRGALLTAADPSYHANLLVLSGAEPALAAALVVTPDPSSPYRVWAE